MSVEELTRKIKFAGSAAMVAVGIVFYWGYALSYGEWDPFSSGNEGVYSIMVFFIGLGIAGMLLFRRKGPA